MILSCFSMHVAELSQLRSSGVPPRLIFIIHSIIGHDSLQKSAVYTFFSYPWTEKSQNPPPPMKVPLYPLEFHHCNGWLVILYYSFALMVNDGGTFLGKCCKSKQHGLYYLPTITGPWNTTHCLLHFGVPQPTTLTVNTVSLQYLLLNDE